MAKLDFFDPGAASMDATGRSNQIAYVLCGW
jgi:hypothetical protein